VIDRRALVFGSWLAKGRDKPSRQRVLSILNRWDELFKSREYKFRSLTNPKKPPLALKNPSRTDLLRHLEEDSRGITPDTEVLLFFLGHSVSVGENDVRLILGTDEDDEDRLISLSWLIRTIEQETKIRKLVVILDTCHAGRAIDAFSATRERTYVMFAAGSAYAFDANFSDNVLRALEQPIQKNDQRIDRQKGGTTWQKIFQVARGRTLSSTEDETVQAPISFGDYVGDVLLKAPVRVPQNFNEFASQRSIYGRLFAMLHLIRNHQPTFARLKTLIKEGSIFLLRRNDDGKDRFISPERLNDYLDFLLKAKWIARPDQKYILTGLGESACNREVFNKALLNTIETEILLDGIDFELLETLIKELLADMIPPTPIKIKDRAGMKGKMIRLDSATRLAIQLLPSTGQFMKGTADTIFPSEMGG
jgi:hypothetical protein